MTIDDIRADGRYWQRLLRLAGYYTGRIDGICGPLQRQAETRWEAAQEAVVVRYGELDARSERNLRTLLPAAQERARAWLVEAIPAAWHLGYALKVICGTRSYAEQNALYAQGRSKPGARVTNARGGYSNHNFGVAFDIGLFRADGSYVEESKPYDHLALAAPPPAGLEWGGNWKSLHDAPHYQYAKYGSSTAAVRERFNA